MCIKHNKKFEEIADESEWLTRYGVQPRYPHEMDISEVHMKTALKYAKHIQAFKPIAEIHAQLEKSGENKIDS